MPIANSLSPPKGYGEKSVSRAQLASSIQTTRKALSGTVGSSDRWGRLKDKKMKIRILNFFLAFMFIGSLNAQSDSLNRGVDPFKNQFSIEIFGASLKYSLGYERIIISQPKINLASRIGLGYFPFNENTLSVPFELTTYWGSERGFVELGLGLTWCQFKLRRYPGVSPASFSEDYYSNTKESKFLPSLQFGYRYQKANKRSSIRFALTFLFEVTDEKVSLFWPQVPIGISYGYRF